jgi:aminopeptidase YwaD
MSVKSLSILSLFVTAALVCAGQQNPSSSLSRLRSHLFYLASDSLEGRRAGTNGERQAASYIAGHFKRANLTFYASANSYFQDFQVSDGQELSKDSRLLINNSTFYSMADFYPLPFSAIKGSFKAEISPSLNERNQVWAMDITDYFTAATKSPHYDIIDELKKFSIKAISRGATGLIFYTKDSLKAIDLYSNKFTEAISIPVIFVKRSSLFPVSDSSDQLLQIEVSFELIKKYRHSQNVIGLINNNQSETVVIGAHYDHLGYGEDGNSMIKSVKGLIHNGADDNASGTSALIELATQLTKKTYRKYNYILIAFSSEELGLLGSKYFVDSHDFVKQPIKFMINMDMVGRLNDSTKTLTIGGYGTSSDWSTIFSKYRDTELKFKFDSSGTGPSDHTSFYRKNTPVLFYFTGLHTDYHKPSDDADKINYGGISKILKHILFTIKSSSHYNIQFIKTREQQTTSSTRFTVSLGIMPDYSYQGEGVRIDGVSEGKLAQKIGLLPSDILVQLGDTKINSVESYMKALSNFKKGDSTELRYTRNGQTEKKTITFQ